MQFKGGPLELQPKGRRERRLDHGGRRVAGREKDA